MSKWLITIVLSMTSLCLGAETLKLATITSEIDKNTTEFYIETDSEDSIDSLRYVTILPNGGIQEDVSVPSETVLREGVVIAERSGHQVIRLEVENFDLKKGGTIKMNYLYSALTGSRSVKRIKLERREQFELLDLNNQKINRMFVKGNWSRLFGVIGVRDIETSYAP